jgi:HEPN domain-containing protein
MPTPKECRLYAEECLELAKQAEEFYVKTALIELAEDVNSRLKK